ncbi:radical SAM family heme chaperone HemW [Conexibacter arvalis]|uniref:Heme chaperone HemW n=1 Tax=Conexibacter arvalis TaxID=912552 RepID=A0A840IGP0_9ACTN|nr:radical SAM family heme chaperone HemW [Conexibacter arvalis]MBB4663128.1 oxygen-independent coproporphyrinogen-3 oxidase [Conexibacter arvalis]
MPAALPDASPAPADGALPETARARLGERPFGIYVHVPFCATRCGYCDFNTYTAEELPGGVSRASYAAAAIAELALARRVLGEGAPPVETVFFGGGTPTLLDPADLVAIVRAIDETFGLAPGAEVTTEANPESVDPAAFAALREGGFTRVSLGMQSAAPHVLATLDRTHTPGRPQAAAAEARAAGFEHVSLDLIYGTPGESDDDWRASVEAALAAAPDHLSAYSLTVEPGTRLHARVRRGELPEPDEDALADRYAIADELLAGAGLRWYEISNWAVDDAARCRHNLAYWRGGDWWGVGPGAHSHVGGVRWWNVLHPSAYAGALREARSPAAGRELLDDETRRFERIMLETRLREGLDMELLRADGRAAAERAVADGLAEPEALERGRVLLTRRGRLLADALVRDLVD